jgi:hypothetical protein
VTCFSSLFSLFFSSPFLSLHFFSSLSYHYSTSYISTRSMSLLIFMHSICLLRNQTEPFVRCAYLVGSHIEFLKHSGIVTASHSIPSRLLLFLINLYSCVRARVLALVLILRLDPKGILSFEDNTSLNTPFYCHPYFIWFSFSLFEVTISTSERLYNRRMTHSTRL